VERALAKQKRQNRSDIERLRRGYTTTRSERAFHHMLMRVSRGRPATRKVFVIQDGLPIFRAPALGAPN
jgi:hypothetical protein